MALSTYEFLPPPDAIQAELGEPRRIRRAGIRLAIGEPFDMTRFPGSDAADKRARREARALALWQRVRAAYDALQSLRRTGA